MSTSSWDNREQPAPGLPAGEGEYKNPLPEVYYRLIEKAVPATATTPYKPEVKHYYAHDFEAVDFPIQMAKPKIMEATTRAMALNLFDEFGILPAQKNKDPLIVGRIKLAGTPRIDRHDNRVTFIIAWALNTAVL